VTGKLVTLESYSDPFKARLVAQRLQEAGIPAFLNGETTALTLGGINPTLAPVHLEVPEDEVERAREVLSRPAEQETGIQTEPDEKDPPEDVNASPYLAERAVRAALFGLLFTPALLGIAIQLYSIQLYSLWLAGRIATREEEMAPEWRWKVYTALALDGVGLLLGAIYVRALFILII
jgi:hypothetical protein